MPTEEYVRDRFEKGMRFEEWLEKFLRSLEDVKVVKRTDVSSEPHPHEQIKYVPPPPNFLVFLTSRKAPVRAWATHKRMDPKRWASSRKYYLSEMFWRYKTYLHFEDDHYLAYGIVHANNPFEVYWCRVSDTKFRGTWSSQDPDQDDLRARIDMSKASLVFDGSKLIRTLEEILQLE
jgi:hypothetical protein